MKTIVTILLLLELISLIFFIIKELSGKGFTFRLGFGFGVLYFLFIPIGIMFVTGVLLVSKKDFGITSIPDVYYDIQTSTSFVLALFIMGVLLFLYSPRLKAISIVKSKGSKGWLLPLTIYITLLMTIFIGSGMLSGGNWYHNRHHFMEEGGAAAVLMTFLLNASKVYFITVMIHRWIRKEITNKVFFLVMAIFLPLDMVLTGNRIYAFISAVIIGFILIKQFRVVVLKYSIIGLPLAYVFGYFASIFRHMRGPLFVNGIPSYDHFISVLNSATKVEPPDVYNFLSGISESVNVNVIYGLFDRFEHPLYGATYLKAILFPIPRKIWEDKPISITNIAGDYFGSESLVTTFIGEMYMNFMLWGVLLIPMFLWLTEWFLSSILFRVPNKEILLVFVGLMIFRMPFSDTILIFLFIFMISLIGSLNINKLIKSLNAKID